MQLTIVQAHGLIPQHRIFVREACDKCTLTHRIATQQSISLYLSLIHSRTFYQL
jgi:hypothetical protein